MVVCRHIAAAVALALSVSALASAQTPEELDHARGIFQEALSLEVAGDYRSALGKLQQVAKVRLTPQVRYHLARCKEHLGRLTEALGDYRVASTEARGLELSELEEIERARLALESRVPKLRLHIVAPSGNTVVELDGVRLGPSVFGAPVLVDPGARRIVLYDNAIPVSTVDVQAIEGQTVDVRIESAAVVRPPSVGPSVAPVVSPVSSPRPWAYVSAGVGGVAVVASVVLFAVRSQALSDLEKACSDRLCPEKMKATAERGQFASWAAPSALGVGAVALGVAAWGFWPNYRGNGKTSRQTQGSLVSVDAGPRMMGVRISSDF